MTHPIAAIVLALETKIAALAEAERVIASAAKRRDVAQQTVDRGEAGASMIRDDTARLCRSLRELTPALGYPEIREACGLLGEPLGDAE